MYEYFLIFKGSNQEKIIDNSCTNIIMHVISLRSEHDITLLICL